MIETVRHLNYAVILLISLALFVFRWPRKPRFVLKLVCWIALYYPVIVLVPEDLRLGSVVIPVNAMAIILMLFLGIRLCFRVSVKAAVYAAISASLLQHVASECYVFLVKVVLFSRQNYPMPVISAPYFYSLPLSLTIILSYGLIYYGAWKLFIQRQKDPSAVEIQGGTLILIVSIAFLLINIIYDNAIHISLSDQPLFMIVDMICCMALLGLLHSLNKAVLDEKVFRQALRDQQNHYNTLAASIEAVNRKSHDLKYQLAAMKNLAEGAERDQLMAQIQHDVTIYENMARTGNAALDNTIAERAMLCEAKKIRFYYMVDGTTLQFMDPVDIYVLFGNLLDNAIECVEQYTQPDKRIIVLNGSIRNGILVIRIENICENTVTIRNGLPMTSKQDTFSHGIGTRSALYIVKKYNGHITYRQEEQMFLVDIVFPPEAG